MKGANIMIKAKQKTKQNHQGRSLVNIFSLEYFVQKCGTFSNLVAQVSVLNS